MANKIRDALNKIRTIIYNHSSATVKDTVYLLAGMPMLAQNSENANVDNVYTISGLIEYAKKTSQAWTGGQKLYWDDGNSEFTTVASGNTLAGVASRAAGSAAITGLVILMPEMKNQPNPAPSHVTVFAGSSVSENDADSEVVVSLTGLLSTDIVQATLRAAANAVYVTKAVPTTDTLTITLSGNGGAGTIVDYSVKRAVVVA